MLSLLLFLIVIFLPLHGQIAVVTIRIFTEYILKILGISLFKLLEAAGKQRANHYRRGSMLDRSNTDRDLGSDSEKITGIVDDVVTSVVPERGRFKHWLIHDRTHFRILGDNCVFACQT